MEPLDLILYSIGLIAVTVLATFGFRLFELACH
jgi:hypothetical protein